MVVRLDDVALQASYIAGEAMGTIAGEAAAALGELAQVAVRDSIAQVQSSANTELDRVVGGYYRALASSISRNRDSRLIRINTIAAQKAQSQIVAAFQATRKGPSPTLERGDRYANGAMLKALSSPNFYKVTARGVGLIDAGYLDRVAKQWYRLNFGAGEVGGFSKRHGSHVIPFLGSTAGALSLQGYGPSKAFRMPSGAWLTTNMSLAGGTGRGDFSRRGQDQFVPLKYLQRRTAPFRGGMTSGIIGTAYLDPGVKTLARELGKGWTVLINEWFAEAAESDTGPISQLFTQSEAAAGLDVIQDNTTRMRTAFVDFESKWRSLGK